MQRVIFLSVCAFIRSALTLHDWKLRLLGVRNILIMLTLHLIS